MTKAFPLFLWKNSPSVETPLSENLLNTINIALSEVDDRVVTHDKTKANQSDLLTTLSDVSYNEKTGIITFTKKNGAKLQIDTKLEKLAVNFTYDKTNQRLVITLEDGTIQYVDMKSLITQFEFVNSDSVIFLVGTDGKVTATIAKGGISADMIEPNYLANVQLYAEQAESSMSSANTNAVASKSYAVGGTNTRPGEDTDNAKYYAELAKAIAVFDVESLIDGTIVVGKAKDADTLDGKHASDFLSTKGGALKGNVSIESEEAKALTYNLKNALREGRFLVHTDGRLGFYDVTNSKWIFSSTSDGTTTFNGTASGNATLADLDNYLPINGGGTVNGSVKSTSGLYTVRIVNDETHEALLAIAGNGRAGLYHRTNNVNDAMLYLSPTELSYQTSVNGATKNYVIHHDGNSVKVVTSTTAPSDTSSVWIDTANKKTKAYIDGAWTVV